MIVFWSGGALKESAVTELETLSLLTIGNLGEGTSVCADGVDGDIIELACPDNSVIGRVEAYYGLPTGVCDCPASRQPTPDCPGTQTGDTCDPDGSFCFLEDERTVKLPDGSEFQAGACCAASLEAGLPNFDELDISIGSCNAPAARRIARGRCLGTERCNIEVHPRVNQTWPASAEYGTECADSSLDKLCSESLSEDGGLGICNWDFLDAGTTVPAGLEMISRSGQHRLVVVAQCFDINVEILKDWHTFSKQDVATFLAVFDVMFVVCFLFAVAWLRTQEQKTVEEESPLRASDYTVYVPSLPNHPDLEVVEENLRRRFEGVVSRAPTINYVLESGGRIADVNFGLDQTELLRALIKYGKSLRRLDKRQVEQQICHSQIANKFPSRDGMPDKLRKRLDKADNLILQAREKREAAKDNLRVVQNKARETSRAVCAFVTFEEVEAAQRALIEYPPSLLFWCCQRRDKRVLGKRIRLQQAPQPSDICWENMEASVVSRASRQVLTAIITLTLLVLSAVAVFLVVDEKRRVQREFQQVECGTLSGDISNKTLVVRDEYYDYYGLERGKTGRLECFCKSQFSISDPSSVLNEPFQVPPDGRVEYLCDSWFRSFVSANLLLYGSSLIILTINFSLRWVLKGLARFEKSRSQSAQLLSRAVKLFVLQVRSCRLHSDATHTPTLYRS